LCIVIVFIMINELINPLTGVIVLAVLIAFAVLFPKRIQAMYGKIQHQFIENFNDRERSEAIRNKSDLTPWDGHMTTFEIPQESLIAGKTLNELKVREELGVNIAIIKRGDLVINIPDKDEKIFPKDIVYVIGTDEQVKDFELFVDKSLVGSVDYHTEIVLKGFELTNEALNGISIRESKIRENSNSIIAGIERNGERILNPQPTFTLQKGDILWLVGDKKKITALFSK
ncbi:MAG: TrkA C-terminal domain-containing protein, partial [Flavobacterium sp.]